MKMEEIRLKARALGIKTKGVRKNDLIGEIQKKEGNFDCFGTTEDYCDQWNCCVREDCLTSVRN
jgi:hypothetical protein